MNADQWNSNHGIGTPVRYWPLKKNGRFVVAGDSTKPVDTETRSEAWELGDGTPVVAIKGKSGGVALDHLELRESTT